MDKFWGRVGEKGCFWGPEMDAIDVGTGFFSLYPPKISESIPHHVLRMCINYFSARHLLTSTPTFTFKHKFWYLPVLLRWTDRASFPYRERKGWYQRELWGRKLPCPYSCHSLRQELLWCMTAASWGEHSSVHCPLSLRTRELLWSDLELLTVAFSSTNKLRVACGDKLLYISNTFKQIQCERSFVKVWMLVTDLLVFLGSGL